MERIEIDVDDNVQALIMYHIMMMFYRGYDQSQILDLTKRMTEQVWISLPKQKH